MKKFLFGILTFLGIGLSFCSAGSITFNCDKEYNYLGFYTLPLNGVIGDTYTYNIQLSGFTFTNSYDHFNYSWGADLGNDGLAYYNIYSSSSVFSSDGSFTFNGLLFGFYLSNLTCDTITITSNAFDGGSCEDKSITVYYNSGNTESILCDGVQAIQINGLSSLTSTNTFTPYYNISYKDEDNQSLIESYSKDILYLENGQFKKTYTGNNDWILSVQGSSENSFSGYLPTFEITGGINEPTESGNIFNNFAENSVKFTLSNIPSYIQYVILLFILFFILGFIRKFRRK